MIPLFTRLRRGPRAPATAAVLAVALLACGCRAEAPSCATGEPLEVDLEAWSAALHDQARSADAAVYDRLLAEVGLPPLPEIPGVSQPGEDAAMSLRSVAVMPLRQGTSDGALDLLIAVRFANAGGAEALRAQLLRPASPGEHAFCPLGDLSRDTEPHEQPCLEPHDGPARALEAQALVAPDRDAVVVRDAGGWCGPGSDRGDQRATSFWGVEEGRLVRYLEIVTLEAWYESPAPPTEIRRAEIDLGGGWPRTITVTEVVECPLGEAGWEEGSDPAAGADGADEGACEPAERTAIYRYEGSRYVASGSPTPERGSEDEADPAAQTAD